jgi:hypothetical protein
MEQRKTVHYEIQIQKKNGDWAALLPEWSGTEKEILELRDRAQAVHPREKVRAVKITTLVAVDEVTEESHSGTGEIHEPHHTVPASEVLQDCD